LNSRRLVEELQKNGLLMLSDRFLPSVARLVAGAEVKGSWWGHPKGHEIFRQAEQLEANPDVLVTRLVSGKVTYLHRSLWADFLSVATARESWQLQGLSRGARRLLKMVDDKGEVRTDKVPGGRDVPAAARDLERRMLAYGEEIHTERGAHAKVLMTWSRCPKVRDLRFRPVDPRKARAKLESTLDNLSGKYSAKGTLPWRQN